MNKCGIYGLHNTANGKWYIGQSLDVFNRKTHHSVATKLKLSRALIDRVRTEETKQRMIESWKIRRQKKEIQNVA